MKKFNYLIAISALIAFSLSAVSAKDLAVNRVDQRYTDAHGNVLGDNWCWAATSKMVLDFYAYSTTLPGIVTYGLGSDTYDTWNYMWGNGSESRTGVQVWEEKKLHGVGTGVYVRRSKTITLTWQGIQPIVKNFSNDEVQTQAYSRALTTAEITNEIDNNDAPFFIRLGWTDTASGASNGGHFIICYGTNADVLSIHDPWFGSYLSGYDAMKNGTGISAGNTHTWTHTLTTSKLLDVVFLFDTTGSMGGVISNAQANAVALLNKISTKFKNYRVAVADYKDYPPPDGTGDYGDYVYNLDQAFTTDKTAAQAAINSLSASGGGDTPEAVFSALSNALAGNGIGAWRTDPAVRRIIILIGDAPGHDPETFPGGTDFGAVVATATNPALPIAVHCLMVGTSIDMTNQFQAIAGGSGGSAVPVDSSTVSTGLQTIVDSVASNPRFPQGDTSSIYPHFTFDVVGAASMAPSATSELIEIQKYNTRAKKFRPYRLVSLRDPTSTDWTSTLPFPVGQYQWRMGFRRRAGKLFLPVLTGSKTDTIATASKTIFETDWTTFNRVKNTPGKPLLLSPSSTFTPSAVKQTYQFGTVPGATRYVLEIKQPVTVHGATVYRVWKRFSLRPSAKDPNPASLSITVGGHNILKSYQWHVEALNYDRPTIDPFAWSPY